MRKKLAIGGGMPGGDSGESTKMKPLTYFAVFVTAGAVAGGVFALLLGVTHVASCGFPTGWVEIKDLALDCLAPLLTGLIPGVLVGSVAAVCMPRWFRKPPRSPRDRDNPYRPVDGSRLGE